MKSQMKINRILISFLFVLSLLPGFCGIMGGEAQAEDIAIKGYDTVAYFKDGAAIKGSESFSFSWHGMTWHFSTKEHSDMFAAAPEKYAPQYDGYCAWAMTESRKAITDPEVWKIVDGKLYLNCSHSAFGKWSADIPGNIKKANANWPKFKSGN